ncbi:hypothetical protein [Actinoallomurus sp. NPDC050550]|uniref:hypothetical protein n=1 Tax=Actinoallomurus sp. NPDC050550 TaxID=3154937 RepID=UPI0034016498
MPPATGRPISLEKGQGCSRGGGHLIRRTTRTPGTRFRVEETSIMRAARAATRWQAPLEPKIQIVDDQIKKIKVLALTT